MKRNDAVGADDRSPVGAASLRRAGPGDAGLVAAWRGEPSAGRFMPNRRRTLAEYRAMLAEAAADGIGPGLAGTVRWIVEAGGEPVGWIRLSVTDREHGVGDVGYGIGEAHRGRGHATAAVRATLGIAFGAAGADLGRVEAVAAVGNAASRRVLEAAGFRFEGVARGLLVIGGERVDHARYGVLREEWAAREGGAARGGGEGA